MNSLQFLYHLAPIALLALGFFIRLDRRLTRIETHLKHIPCLQQKLDKNQNCPL
jgi:hypothetical protein